MARNVIRWEEAHGTTGEMAEGPVRTYTRTYYATVSHFSVDPFYIFQYYKCPKLGLHHEYDKAAYCTRVKINQVGASNIYKVVTEWTTAIDDPKNDPNPLNRPAEISITGSLKEVPTILDSQGKPRINPAGDLQVGKTLKPIESIRVKKNVAKIPAWFWDAPGSVNKSSVKIEKHRHAPRTLKLLGPTRPDKILENGKWFYPLEFTLEHDRDTWDSVEVARGFHEIIHDGYEIGKNGTVKRLVKRRITVGTPPEYPKEMQYLDKFGRAITLTEDKKTGGVDLSKIVIQYKRDLRETDLTKLPYK